jgi:hypothetical protein
MGLQNRKHTTFSYPETVTGLPPTKGAFGENVKRVHDLKQ